LLLEHARKRRVRLSLSSERVVSHGEARLLRPVTRLPLHLEQCGSAVTTRKHYEANGKAAPRKGWANVQRPPLAGVNYICRRTD
jgi:hypothetical protein